MAISKLVINKATSSYRLIIKNGGFEVVVTDQESQVRTVTATDVSFDAAASILFLTIDGVAYRAHIIHHDTAQGQTWQVVFSHASTVVTVSAPMPKRELECPEQPKLIPANKQGLFTPAKHSVEGVCLASAQVLQSPLAGRVSRIVATQGQQVKRGQPILYIESMKMENEIGAPSDVFIKTILINEGNVVQPEQILVEFEGEGGSNAATKNVDDPTSV